jgi:hypothetical protein
MTDDTDIAAFIDAAPRGRRPGLRSIATQSGTGDGFGRSAAGPESGGPARAPKPGQAGIGSAGDRGPETGPFKRPRPARQRV